jgi:hypothetical protein
MRKILRKRNVVAFLDCLIEEFVLLEVLIAEVIFNLLSKSFVIDFSHLWIWNKLIINIS